MRRSMSFGEQQTIVGTGAGRLGSEWPIPDIRFLQFALLIDPRYALEFCRERDIGCN
jgi:hypothetical protein